MTNCDPGQRSESTGNRPNVLLIVLDTVRADYLGCYGSPRPLTSPNVDALALEGVRYTHAIAPDFWTLPSHASLLTGLYPTEAGATSETLHLPREAETLAERLHERGYATIGVVFNTWLSKERGFDQGFSEYREMWREQDLSDATPTEQLYPPGVDGIIAAMRRHSSLGTPFFMFVNLNVAHLPYDPAPAFEVRFLRHGRPADRVMLLRNITDMWGHLAGAFNLDDDDYAIMRDLYAAETAMVDAYVGEIIAALRQDGTLDDTLVIVTSDHGENIGEHGMIGHALSMYETTLHVPLIIRYPKRFAAGRLDGRLVSLVDIVPTVLDCANLADEDAPAGAERLSLCSGDRPQRDFVVSENDRPVHGIELLERRYPGFDRSKVEHRMRVIRTERYKLVWRDDEKMEVYDLEEDPHELHDIAASSPEIRDQLRSQLRDWMNRTRSGTDSKMFESTDEESLRHLKALGYVE